MEAIDERIVRFLSIGDGSGDGSGYGYGSGIKTFDGHAVYLIDDVQTIIYIVRGDYANGAILRDDLTLDPCFIAKAGDCFAHAPTLRQARVEAESKALEAMPLEERIARFKERFPSLETVAKCREFYVWHHTLTGSCTMGRDEFIRAHGLEVDKDYTVGYFLDITRDAYGRDAIKALREAYE